MRTLNHLVRGKKILLVDDETGYGYALGRLATTRGISLDTVKSNRLVDVIAGIEKYDLVMLSDDLDAFTGHEIAEFLGRNLPRKPLVMLTAANKPWTTPSSRATPTVKAVVNKWDGMENVIEQAISVGERRD